MPLNIVHTGQNGEGARTYLGVATHPQTLELKISDAQPNCMQMQLPANGHNIFTGKTTTMHDNTYNYSTKNTEMETKH